MSNIVQSHMIDILEQLINESNGLPQDVIDIILAQFLKKRKVFIYLYLYYSVIYILIDTFVSLSRMKIRQPIN
jgi:hypothetical protein